MQQLYPKYKDRIAFIPVSLDSSTEETRRFVSENSLKFDVYVKPQGEMLAQLNIRYIPTLVFVDPAGEVKQVVVGVKSDAEMTKLLDDLVK